MSISSALGIAFSGLKATQAGLDVVSQNVANSGTSGYTRRTLSSSDLVAGGQTAGVDVAGATRTLDTIVQKQLRLETSGAAYTAVKATGHTALDALLDPTTGTNLSSLVSDLTSAFQGLNANPASYSARATTVAAARTLTSTLQSYSSGILSLRQGAEDALAQGVDAANGLLKQIADTTTQLRANPTSAALQDQRDGLVDQLSQYLDVKATTDAGGSLTLSTTGGVQLYDGNKATTLAFDRHTLTATSAYSTTAANRSVGTITASDGISTRDLVATGGIRSGQFAAYLDLRDEVLPEAQAQLDTFAAGLASSLSNRTVAGTAATAGAATGFDLDLSGLSDGNTLAVSVASGGTARTFTFVKTESAAAAKRATSADGTTVGIDFSGGLSSVATQVAAKLGAGYAVSNPSGTTLRIVDDGAANTTNVTALSGSATVSGTASGNAALALFTDGAEGKLYTGSFEGTSQKAGLSSRLSVNPAVISDNGTLVAYASGTLEGDTTRPAFLFDRLTTATVKADGSVGVGGTGAAFSGTLAGLAGGIIATQANAANAATSLNSGQQVALNAVQSRFSSSAGVDLDTELTQLIQLQTAYGANARVITASKDMLDMLMRVGA